MPPPVLPPAPAPARSSSPSHGEVDSALLSALRDSRERIALLKLERVLVAFMRERTTGYIEVGGPYNSIVIGGGAKVAGAAGASGPGATSSGGLSSGGLGVSALTGGSGSGGRSILQSAGSGRQTTFQRLCLHRLADRFGIVRESASTMLEYEGGGSERDVGIGVGGGFQPTLIRLVKTKDSKSPPKLLIDLDSSVYSLSSSSRASDDADPVASIAHDLSSSSLTEPGERKTSSAGVGGGSSARQPTRKMVIMKRSSSATGSTGSLSGRDGDAERRRKKRELKGKNMSDKERAYAEARARILGVSAEEREGQGQGHQRDQGQGLGRRANQHGQHTGKHFPSSENLGGVSNHTSPSGSPPITPQRIDSGENEFNPTVPVLSPPDREGSAGSGGGHRSRSSSSSRRENASKVTWRNRRQEETDPDFRRGGSILAGGSRGPQHTPAAVVPMVQYGSQVGLSYGGSSAAMYAMNGQSQHVMVQGSSAPAAGLNPNAPVHQPRGVMGSPTTAGESKTFYPQGEYSRQQHQHQQQYYYQTQTSSSAPRPVAQAYHTPRGSPYQYGGSAAYSYPAEGGTAPTSQQQLGVAAGAAVVAPAVGPTYASARSAVADVHSMEEFPSLGGCFGVGDGDDNDVGWDNGGGVKKY